MNILIFNWRDIKNPKSGGAELVTHEISSRWVKWGHSVTLFTSSFSGAKKEEIIDGVRIIRRGSQGTVHAHAFLFYNKYFKGKFDIVIDEINTIPFFTPFYVKEKKIAYFNQIAKEVWLYEFPKPFSYLGNFLEPYYLKPYRKFPAMVISPSTKESLAALGFKNVSIFPMAVNSNKTKIFLSKKEKNFTLIYVGRLVPSKRVDDIIIAFYLVIQKLSSARLWIVGEGQGRYKEKLNKMIKNLHLENRVKFWGFVAEEKKYQLMSQAHVLLATSVREGWGLIVTEASSLKTPSVVYNVPGLKDAVKNGQTGLITSANNPFDLAQNVLSLKKDPKLYSNLQKNGFELSRSLTWDNTAREALKIIEGVYGQ